MHWQLFLLIASLVVSTFATPLPVDAYTTRGVITNERRNTFSSASFLTAFLKRDPIIEPIPSLAPDVDLEKRIRRPGGGSGKTRSVEADVNVDLEKRIRRPGGGSGKTRSVEADVNVDLEKRIRRPGGGSGKTRSVEADVNVDLEKRIRRPGGGSG